VLFSNVFLQRIKLFSEEKQGTIFLKILILLHTTKLFFKRREEEVERRWNEKKRSIKMKNFYYIRENIIIKNYVSQNVFIKCDDVVYVT
jgi:hypothetical protein